MRVLYVEDDSDLGGTVVRMMRSLGLQPRWCQTYTEAVSALTDDVCAEVCIADFDLHDADGRTGLDLLLQFEGRRVLCSGLDRVVPASVEFVRKERLSGLLDELGAQVGAQLRG